ncbi:hypothetical protein BS17DRAFT_599685 [Gyrodon lividus]|nr:hypothetical protein BS17DRAFT_599685 [Gyrodon lividus]
MVHSEMATNTTNIILAMFIFTFGSTRCVPVPQHLPTKLLPSLNMSAFRTGQRQGLGVSHRPFTFAAPNLSTIPSSTFVTSSSASFTSLISAPFNQSRTLADSPDANALHLLNASGQHTNIKPSDAGTGDMPLPSLRSTSSMRGLLLAEMGDSMVELDIFGRPGGSGYRVGQRIEEGWVTPGGSSVVRAVGDGFEMGRQLWRQDGEDNDRGKGTWKRKKGTITGKGKDRGKDKISAPPHKSTSELRTLLGNSASRLKPNSSVIPHTSLRKAASTGDFSLANNDEFISNSLALEKAKSRTRVEVDIVLESEICVQGGWLKGHIKIHVRKNAGKKQNTSVLLSKAKVRVVGYEAIPYGNTRCTFYQCTALLSHVAPAWHAVLASPPDKEGWAEAKEGIHMLPFALFLPADASCGIAKGILDSQSGVALRYFAMASLRLKDPQTSAESVAHFYRSCEIWPRLSFTTSLSPAPRPLVSEATKNVFMGGNGKVRLSATMHRLHWIAGQRCVVHLRVVNESKKTVKGAAIALERTTTVFKPLRGRKGNTDPDPDACETKTTRKVIAASVLVMGQKCTKGHASAKGWWAGVRPGETADFVHHIVVPTDALSVARVRLLEVEHILSISVSTGGLSSDVEVTLPIRIINFLSLDPPPSSPLSQLHQRVAARPQLGTRETWYRKSRPNAETEETVPGMKYSSTDMTVVAQDGEIGSSTTRYSIISQNRDQGDNEIHAGNISTDSASVYPPSESTRTITQQRTLPATNSLDEIDYVIGTDSRIQNFVIGAGRLTTSGSTGSQLGPRGPRLRTGMPLRRAITPLDPQEQSTPPKRHSVKSNTFADRVQEKMAENGKIVKPFVERQPDMTRASSMLVVKTGVDEGLKRIEMRNRSVSDMLTPRAR